MRQRHGRCNGGRGGFLVGNGGHRTQRRQGRQQRLLFGNGGDGGNGLNAEYNTQTVTRHPGRHGRRGGRPQPLVGNGGKGGIGMDISSPYTSGRTKVFGAVRPPAAAVVAQAERCWVTAVAGAAQAASSSQISGESGR